MGPSSLHRSTRLTPWRLLCAQKLLCINRVQKSARCSGFYIYITSSSMRDNFRQWTVSVPKKDGLTQAQSRRQISQLALVSTRIYNGNLILEAPGVNPLTVPLDIKLNQTTDTFKTKLKWVICCFVCSLSVDLTKERHFWRHFLSQTRGRYLACGLWLLREFVHLGEVHIGRLHPSFTLIYIFWKGVFMRQCKRDG